MLTPETRDLRIRSSYFCTNASDVERVLRAALPLFKKKLETVSLKAFFEDDSIIDQCCTELSEAIADASDSLAEVEDTIRYNKTHNPEFRKEVPELNIPHQIKTFCEAFEGRVNAVVQEIFSEIQIRPSWRRKKNMSDVVFEFVVDTGPEPIYSKQDYYEATIMRLHLREVIDSLIEFEDRTRMAEFSAYLRSLANIIDRAGDKHE